MNQNYLSRENTDCLKGICAIMVVICHVCSRTNIGASIGLGPIYTAFGYWVVSGFMFMSGYGLTRSILNKYNGGGYLQIFLSKRVLPIYMLMALLSVVYYGMGHLLALEPPSLSCFIQSFFFGNTVIKFGWFLQAIVVIYLLFYISARISTKVAHTNPEAALCILMTFALSLYMGGCLIMNLSDTWYETVLAFLAGMLIAANKPVVDMILATKWHTIWILTILLFAFAFCFLFRRASFVPELPAMILKMITSPLFVLCWIPVMRLKSLANPFTAFLSKLFLEIYICQGLAFLLLSNKYWNLEGWSFFFSVFPLTILMAWTVKPLTTRFMEWGKNLRNSIKSK